MARFVNTFEALYGDFAEEDVIHLIPTAVDDVASFISTSPYLSPFFSCAQALSLHAKLGVHVSLRTRGADQENAMGATTKREGGQQVRLSHFALYPPPATFSATTHCHTHTGAQAYPDGP